MKAGHPKELLNDPATGVHSPKKESRKKSPEKKPSKSPVKCPATQKSNLQPSTSTPTTSREVVEECNCSLAKMLGPTPCPAPPGKVWAPIWTLQNEAAHEAKNKSFEELVEKMKGSSNKPQKKRRKIDLMTKVITDDEYLKAIKEKEGKQLKKGSNRGSGRPQILQESMNELISEEDFNFLEDGRYNDEIRTVYYDLLRKNVSIEN